MQSETKRTTEREMHLAGLAARLKEYAAGTVHLSEPPSVGPSPLVRAYADGYRDADDDSDEPRPDDDEEILNTVALLIYQQIARIDADVSAWPEYDTGRIRLADDLTDVAHEPCALLATLRGLPAGCGTEAMWRAVSPASSAQVAA
jgi:hypothetical protein